MSSFPIELRELIATSFVRNKAYGQIATIDGQGQQTVRTVHLHYLEASDTFAFSTHERSQKAKDVLTSKKISGCYWDEKNQVQFRFAAEAELLAQDSHPDCVHLLSSLWSSMREETRMAYALDEKNIPYDVEPLPAGISVEPRALAHCAVEFKPIRWDVHRFDPRGYRFGTRTEYEKKNGAWRASATRLIY